MGIKGNRGQIAVHYSTHFFPVALPKSRSRRSRHGTIHYGLQRNLSNVNNIGTIQKVFTMGGVHFRELMHVVLRN